MRSIVVGSGSNGMSCGLGGAEPGKKFSSAECLQALMDAINDDPSLVRNHIQLVTSDQRDEMDNKLWPAIFDPTNWTRVATHRPSKDEEGNVISGTDLEIREYENDVWADETKVLIGEVSTEFGEVTDIKVTVRW